VPKHISGDRAAGVSLHSIEWSVSSFNFFSCDLDAQQSVCKTSDHIIYVG